jgi:hypothetical protein
MLLCSVLTLPQDHAGPRKHLHQQLRYVISRSKQLESSVPPAAIASLSSGEFVGMVAENPDELITLKTFHARIVNDPIALKKGKEACV